MNTKRLLAGVTLFAPGVALAEGAADWVKPFSDLNAGDTAWVLIAAALVLFMTVPGLALFYGGMVRKKNILSMMVQSFAVTALVSVLWMVVGYSIAFTPNNGFVGGMDRFMLHGMNVWLEKKQLTVFPGAATIPETVFMMFQMTFAVISTAIITGAFAERMKFKSMLVFSGLWVLAVYAPTAHWVWEPGGFLSKAGTLDYAGGTVVHINAGVAGLVAAMMIGRRVGYGKEPMAPFNLALTLMGAGMLWFGWFGFNAGSALAADARADMAMVTTQVATAAAALTWLLAEKLSGERPSALGVASGAVAGLVGITPGAGFVSPQGALAVGVITAVVCFLAVTRLKRALKYDDSLDAFGIHGVGGICGALLTAALVSNDISGASANWAGQIEGVLITVVYSAAVSFVILKILDKTIGLRVGTDEEREGLDLSTHGERIE